VTSITVQIKSVFGRDVIYPACAKATGFCKLIGQKSLTDEQIVQIKSLGYEVKVQSNHPTTL
jgi:hypothetical protein